MSISSSAILDALFALIPSYYSTDPVVLARYNALIALIRCQFNERVLSCCGVMAYVFLLAHYLTLGDNPNIGVYNNIKEGDLSLGFNVAPDMNSLNLTPWGRAYQDLIKRTVIGSTVTNLPPSLGGVIQNNPVNAGCCGGFGWGWGNAGF